MTLKDCCSVKWMCTYYSREEAKKMLLISEATFHKYVSILRTCWSDNFNYIPRQTHWSNYQVHCLIYTRDLFRTGRNELEVIDYINRFGIPN